jgi:aspartate carbamoyltransferase catalytic subunit
MTQRPDRGVLEKALAAWSRRHVLDLDDWSIQEIEMVLGCARQLQQSLGDSAGRLDLLAGRTIVTLFYEASTRTRGSFEMAAKRLSADVINITAQGSSVAKGESLADTIATLQAMGPDAIVMRHPSSGAHYSLLPGVGVPLINAGDGWHAHPTQALLDLYTMQRHQGRMAGKKVVIIGDVRHSRVARSNIWCLDKVGARIVVCAPPTLLPPGLGRENGGIFPEVEVEMDIERALAGADVVMALRLQKERMQGGVLPSVNEFVGAYQLNARRLKLAGAGALVMHPGPINEGIEITREVARGPQSSITEQVANGVAVRMALLYLLTGKRAS